MGYTDLFSFYRSKEWEVLRRQITIERVNDSGDLICEHCGKPIVKEYDAICHHKVELTEGNVQNAMIALNPDNIMVVHHRCHNQIHERFGYQTMTRHIYVVWGSPCAGKSAYVDANAGKGDLVIDIDRLYQAVGVGGSRGAVKNNVMALYRLLVDMVRTRSGRWRTAWIVRTLPLEIDRESIVKTLGGGELVHIDTPMNMCINEARSRGGEWEDWVREWWTRYGGQ